MPNSDDDFIKKTIAQDELLEPLRQLIRTAYGHTKQFHTDVAACPICKKDGKKSVLTWELHPNGHIHLFCADANCIRSME